jgi:small-conductance mechanosensitive channel
MSGVRDLPGRFRDGVGTFGRELGRMLRRQGRQVVTTIEERPDVGPIDVELPYPLPTRDQPLALVLFFGAGLTLVISMTLVISSYVLMGHVPGSLITAVGAIAVVLGMAGNLTVIARPIEDNATTALRPMLGAGIPLLNALHYWFNPVVAVLAMMYVMVHASNNWLLPVAALTLLVWAVTGLLLKLPRDSPWNGPMLRRWAGRLHKQPTVYVLLIALVSIGFLADLIY